MFSSHVLSYNTIPNNLPYGWLVNEHVANRLAGQCPDSEIAEETSTREKVRILNNHITRINGSIENEEYLRDLPIYKDYKYSRPSEVEYGRPLILTYVHRYYSKVVFLLRPNFYSHKYKQIICPPFYLRQYSRGTFHLKNIIIT